LSSALRKAENSLCASSTARVNWARVSPRRASSSSLNSRFLPLARSVPLSRSVRLWLLACRRPSIFSRARLTSQRAR